VGKKLHSHTFWAFSHVRAGCALLQQITSDFVQTYFWMAGSPWSQIVHSGRLLLVMCIVPCARQAAS